MYPRPSILAGPQCPRKEGPSPSNRICISACTRKSTFLCMAVTALLYVLANSTCLIPQLHYGFSLSLWPVLSKRLYLASAFVSSWKQNGIQFTIWSVLNCLSLSGFLKCNRGCHGGNLFWKSRTDLHPYCILCQGFRKVKHSHWVHIIDRGHSSLQTKILDDIYSWTGTISTVK